MNNVTVWPSDEAQGDRSGPLTKFHKNSKLCHLSDIIVGHIILHHLITDADSYPPNIELDRGGWQRSNGGRVLYASNATTLTDPGQMRTPLKKHQLKVAT